ncbi:MAG: ribosome-associated translation inhibitor RaiA [Rickettsiella sp.]|nr:ribosome-associated translation inhibitor RaiA [Rickettsiella sp.]
MQITITNDGIKVTGALKQHIDDKFKRLERITSKTTAVHITLSLENLQQVAKALVNEHGIEFYARSESEDLYSAIDALIDKLELQINKHKKKEKEKRHDKSENFDIDKGPDEI